LKGLVKKKDEDLVRNERGICSYGEFTEKYHSNKTPGQEGGKNGKEDETRNKG